MFLKKLSINKSKFFFLIFLFFFILIFSKANAANVEIISDFPGSGPEIKNHYKVTVHYKGTLENGTEFDSSFKRNQPFIFQIGVRQVIIGWEKGLIGMKVGGKRKIKIPPELAYGDKGAGKIIPPNSTLIFEIEVISIQPPKYNIISSKDFSSKKDNDFVIIDIRTEEEWKKTGIIIASKKITAFDSYGNFNPGFLNKLKSVTKKNKLDSKIIFISKKGETSAILANGFVEQLGYKNVYTLEGGIDQWIKDGYNLR